MVGPRGCCLDHRDVHEAVSRGHGCAEDFSFYPIPMGVCLKYIAASLVADSG